MSDMTADGTSLAAQDEVNSAIRSIIKSVNEDEDAVKRFQRIRQDRQRENRLDELMGPAINNIVNAANRLHRERMDFIALVYDLNRQHEAKKQEDADGD